MNRSNFGLPKINITNIKQEMDDDMNLEHDANMRSLEYLESMNKSNKKEKDMLQNVLSNGQTISLTEAGKLVLNNYKEPSQQGSSGMSNNNRSNKLITVYPSSQSNIVLLSNNQNNPNSGTIKLEPGTAPIKVVTKKPVFTEVIKTTNGKTIPVNKLPFSFQSKPGSNQVIKRYVLTNTPGGTGTGQAKDEEIKKLNEEIRNLKKELGDYKELIIAKDLEIEKLKKKLTANNTTTEFSFD